MKKSFGIILALLLVICSACSLGQIGTQSPSLPLEGNLRVTYIDVGQGDSSLIITPSGKIMLIDSGESDAEDAVKQALAENHVQKIDVLVGTHPHSDHIGSMSYIVDDYDVGKVYLPKASSTTKTYERLLSSIKKKGMKVSVAKAGVEIPLDDQVNAVIVAPCSSDYKDLNDCSVVIKLSFGNTSFLFTGDAEAPSEADMVSQYGADLKSTVLKAGHHGSRTSSSQEFLDTVQPEYAVISLGKGNDYGHPHEEALKRFADIGAQVFRTDQLGSIQIVTDGTTLSVNGKQTAVAPSSSGSIAEPEASVSDAKESGDSMVYITKSGKAYHRKDCSHISNSQVSAVTVAEAKASGLSPCKSCMDKEV